MSNSTNHYELSYDIDDLIQVKFLVSYDKNNGVEKDGIYRVIGANRDSVTVMTTKGTFVSLHNSQVERWETE